jgi:hypothetical protein
VAAARLICVDTVGDSREFALHCSSFLDDTPAGDLIEIKVCGARPAEKMRNAGAFSKRRSANEIIAVDTRPFSLSSDVCRPSPRAELSVVRNL